VHLDPVDGAGQVVDLLLQLLLHLLDVVGVLELLEAVVEAGIVDLDLLLLLVDEVARLRARHLNARVLAFKCKTKITLSLCILTMPTGEIPESSKDYQKIRPPNEDQCGKQLTNS
jgi:hypothetical protein